MAEYTPSTEDVRNEYTGFGESGGAEFDRWLAAHDRAVEAEALREAAGRLVDVDIASNAVFWDGKGYEQVTYWLRTRADKIEGGTE